MNAADIQTRLEELFDRCPVVVWDDPGTEFADLVSELDLPGVTCMSDVDGDRFDLKRLVNERGRDERVLVYRPGTSEGPDWLLDVACYAPHFSADATSVLLEELGAADTPEMRAAARAFSPLLRKKRAACRVRTLRAGFSTPAELACAVIACALGNDVRARAEDVVLAFMTQAERDGAAVVTGRLEAAGAGSAFPSLLREVVGFEGDAAADGELATHVLLCSLGVDEEALTPQTWRAADLVRQWERLAGGDDGARDALWAAARRAEEAAGLRARLRGTDMARLARIDPFPVVDELLVARLAKEIGQPGTDLDEARDVIERRLEGVWRDRFGACYVMLAAAVEVVRCYDDRREGFAAASAADVWADYTGGGYRMDEAYRHFHRAYAELRMRGEGADVDLTGMVGRVEGIYHRWFLRELSGAWEKAAGDDLASRGRVTGVDQQDEFFVTHVEGLLGKARRAWVVVSDALRYEVGAELAQRLERTTQGRVTLTSMEAVFPSVTACGMAALLPHATYRLRERAGGGLEVLVDGNACLGTAARARQIDEFLATHHPGVAGTALQAADFMRMSRDERRRAVGDAAVVYLYHNRIDAIGDEAATEADVFRACSETVSELGSLVSLLVREFRATDVLITADHGFTYTYEPLAEAAKVGVGEVEGHVVESGRRYVVAREGARSQTLLAVSLDAVSEHELCGLAPREAIRLRQRGGGENYVHGGVSLQELCVPLLHFRNYRSNARGFTERTWAGLSLVGSLATITNLSFSLTLLQDRPVSGKVLPARYEVTLVDETGSGVTDAQVVGANRDDADPTRRTFTVRLSVREGFAGREGLRCRLVARNLDDSGAETTLTEPVLSISTATGFDAAW